MTYETRWAIASGLWSDTAIWSHAIGSPGGSSVPGDLDTAVIHSGMRVVFDVDQSTFGSGLANLEIRGSVGGNQPPGMLIFASGTHGYLKLAPGAPIYGATSVVGNYGRLLANETGQWEDNNPLPIEYSGIIFGHHNAYINLNYLAIKLRSARPRYSAAHLHSGIWPVVITNDQIGTHPPGAISGVGVNLPANGTEVCFYSSDIYPSGCYDIYRYSIRGSDGNICKLGYQNNDTTTFPLSGGSGTFYLYHIPTNYASGINTIGTVEDLTTDPCWRVGDLALLVNSVFIGGAPDNQKTSISGITNNTITIKNAIDSVNQNGSRLWLGTRNVQIISNTHSVSNFSFFRNSSVATTKYTYCDVDCGMYNQQPAVVAPGTDWPSSLLRDVPIPSNMSGIYIFKGVIYNWYRPLFGVYGLPEFPIVVSGNILYTLEYITYICRNLTFYGNIIGVGDTTFRSVGDSTAFSILKIDANIESTQIVMNYITGVEMQGCVRNVLRMLSSTSYVKNAIFGPRLHCYQFLTPGIVQGFANINTTIKGAKCTGFNPAVRGGWPSIIYGNENVIFEGGTTAIDPRIYPMNRSIIRNFTVQYSTNGFSGPTNAYMYNSYIGSTTQAENYLWSSNSTTSLTRLDSSGNYLGGLIAFNMKNSSGIIDNNSIKAWTRGGYAVTENAPVGAPFSESYVYRIVCQSSPAYSFIDIPIYIKRNTLIQIDNYIKLNSTDFTENPSISLMDEVTLSELYRLDSANHTNWQTLSMQYTPTQDMYCVLRTKAADNSKEYYWMFNIVKGLGGAGLILHPGLTGGIRG